MQFIISFVSFQLFGDDEARMDKWIKKLYNYRQRVATQVET